jgi:hypothetical protein
LRNRRGFARSICEIVRRVVIALARFPADVRATSPTGRDDVDVGRIARPARSRAAR